MRRAAGAPNAYDRRVSTTHSNVYDIDKAIAWIEENSIVRRGEHVAVILLTKERTRLVAGLQRMATREGDTHTEALARAALSP